MAKLDTQPYKGVRDFYPEERYIQNYIFHIWRSVSERFGYEEYEASILEPAEIYRQKTGDEIVNEQMYVFTDKGGREVALRPEMTPTLARMVAAKRRELGFPLRWYSIPNLFRYEATQRGRLREHWQLNVDIFGVENVNAELELITLADRILKSFGAKPDQYEIRMNTHGSMDELEVVRTKLGEAGILNTTVDPTLKRGQAYYTGIVFEFFDTNPENNRSILGGGRYDNLTTLFGDEPLPAAGFGWGDVTTRDFLETHNLLPPYRSAAQLALLPINLAHATEVAAVAEAFRMGGLNVAVDWSGRKVGDMIKAADKLKIPFVAVIGEDELASKKTKVKNLATGEEKEISWEHKPQAEDQHGRAPGHEHFGHDHA